jgi:hypothetical protein
MKFGVLQGDAADEIRRDLIAARDAASRQAVPESRLALGLTVLRRHQPSSPVTAPVVTAVAPARRRQGRLQITADLIVRRYVASRHR